MSNLLCAGISVSLLVCLAVLFGSIPNNEIDLREVNAAFSQVDSRQVFAGFDVEILRRSKSTPETIRKIRFRQLSENKYRIDIDGSTTMARSNDLAFEAQNTSGEFVFSSVGYGGEVLSAVEKQVFEKLFLTNAATSAKFPSLSLLLTKENFLSCTEKEPHDSELTWDIAFKTGTTSISHGNVILFPNLDFMVKEFNLYMGEPNAAKLLSDQEIGERPDGQLQSGEKWLLDQYYVSYREVEGRWLPVRCETKDGLIWEVVSVKPIEDDSSIFLPESIGLKSPGRPFPMTAIWIGLAITALCLSGYYLKTARN